MNVGGEAMVKARTMISIFSLVQFLCRRLKPNEMRAEIVAEVAGLRCKACAEQRHVACQQHAGAGIGSEAAFRAWR
eukprot:10913384-Alexandrium_andersonii.AAC.1